MKKIFLSFFIALSFLNLVNAQKQSISQILAYPNPFIDHINIHINLDYGDSLNFSLCDLNGFKYISLSQRQFYKSETIILKLDSLTEGIFIASILINSESVKSKVIKKEPTSGVILELHVQVNPIEKELLKIFPNPADSELNIQFQTSASEVMVSIYGLNGKQHSSYELRNDLGFIEESLDISYLKNGVYILKIISPEGSTSKRFIKDDNQSSENYLRSNLK